MHSWWISTGHQSRHLRKAHKCVPYTNLIMRSNGRKIPGVTHASSDFAARILNGHGFKYQYSWSDTIKARANSIERTCALIAFLDDGGSFEDKWTAVAAGGKVIFAFKNDNDLIAARMFL